MKQHRIQELQKNLARNTIDAVVIMQPRDLYYYSGTAQPCNLIVPQKGDPVLLVRRGWSFVCEETWIADYEKGGGGKSVLKKLKQMGIDGGVVGVEMDVVPYALIDRMNSLLEPYTLVNASPLFLEQRMIKDPEEIERMRKASLRFDLLHRTIKEHLRPGIREVDLFSKILEVETRNEAEQILFIRRWDDWLPAAGTIVSGENLYRISGHAHTVTGTGLGAALPWGPSTREIHEGDLVVADCPLNYRGYHVDNARTYVLGQPNKRQEDTYRSLLEVQDSTLKRIRPGVPVNEVFEHAMEKVKASGFEAYFQGYGDSQGKYVGHGVGLEVDEPPVIDSDTTLPVQTQMTLAVECKFIIPDFGAVFIEDTVVVQEQGVEILTRSERTLAVV
ncbi:MAG: aminopeptidase P family protein [Deltaproteobacteria bacterium]|nr:aminopeptidase P family protein [Deltaproteobacteria bacterium]